MKKFFLLIFLFPIFLLGSVSVTVNGSSYTIPQTNERGWGTAVTSWIQAISANTIQPTGGVFTLTNDLDLGATFGIKTNYIKSRNSNISSTGLIRLNNTDFLGWRNFANSGDLTLSVNTSNALLFNSIALADISTAQTLTNKTVAFASNTLTGVASTSTAQVITNKDIDGGTASNTSRITLPSAAKTSLDALTRKAGTIVYDTTSSKPYYDDGSTLKAIGSSSGATNYLTLGDAEGGTTGIVVSKNTAAAARPDTGFATGATNITLTTSSSSPLSGVNSFILTKDAANRQGEQVYFPFTIDSKDKAKVLQISLDYVVNSGTFVAGSSSADSDLIAYIYDVTNGVFIEPSSFKFLSNSTSIADKFVANFQTASNSTSYRLIFHVASTSTAAYSIKFEGAVNPSSYVYGTPITDWIAYTSTLTNFTVSSQKFYYRRVGDSMEIAGLMVLNAAPSSTLYWTMPSGFTIDSAKIDLTSNDGNYGTANIVRSVTANYQGAVQVGNSAGRFRIVNSGGGNEWNATLPLTFASGDRISVQASFPITGWSSNVQQSDSYDGRLIAASYSSSVGTSVNGTPAVIPFATKVYDTTNSWNGTDTYTCPSQGTYSLNATLTYAFGSYTAGHYIEIYVFKNGSQIYGSTQGASATASNYVSSVVSTDFICNAGDTIQIKARNDATRTLDTNAFHNIFTIKKIQAPTTISATERVVAVYNTSSQALGTGTEDTLIFTTKDTDTHNAYNTSTGIFTAPVAGTYSVTCLGTPSARASAVYDVQSNIFANSVKKAQTYNYNSSTTTTHLYNQTVSRDVTVLAGQPIACVTRAGGASYVLDGSAERNYISIRLVK